jgi:hypothetical protein
MLLPYVYLFFQFRELPFSYLPLVSVGLILGGINWIPYMRVGEYGSRESYVRTETPLRVLLAPWRHTLLLRKDSNLRASLPLS